MNMGYCLFCAGPIQDGEVYCADCIPIVEELDHMKRKELDKLLADEKSRAALVRDFQRVKECMAECIQLVKNAIDSAIEHIAARQKKEEE